MKERDVYRRIKGFLEALDQRVYGRRQVVDLLGVPPLAIIPLVPAQPREGLRRWLAPAS